MNREILFRGKRVDGKGWVYGGCVQAKSGKVYIFQGNDGYKIVEDDCCEVTPSTVGQFTGLTDKNGVKIFEGDIRDFDGGLGQVIWIDESFAIKSPGSEAVDWEHSSVFINSTLLTTIHDNPTT